MLQGKKYVLMCGLSTDACVCAGAMFVECVKVATLIPQTLPSHKLLRLRFIAFIHRMVESLMAVALPQLPPALQALMLGTTDARDTTDVLQLLQQLITRFKGALTKLLEQCLPPVIALVHSLLGGLGFRVPC